MTRRKLARRSFLAQVIGLASAGTIAAVAGPARAQQPPCDSDAGIKFDTSESGITDTDAGPNADFYPPRKACGARGRWTGFTDSDEGASQDVWGHGIRKAGSEARTPTGVTDQDSVSRVVPGLGRVQDAADYGRGPSSSPRRR